MTTPEFFAAGFRFRSVAAGAACCLAQLAWGVPACPDAARIVSVQGTVEVHRPAAARWEAARLDDAVCAGDMVRVGEGGRAALLLANETTLRLDQNSTLTLQPRESSPQTLIDLVGGAINVISRTPAPFRIHTPFVNANIKGTEFLVAVKDEAARVSVFEGLVTADNERGSVDVTAGEVAVAGRGEAPHKEILLRPADAVQWALYVPAVMAPLPSAGAPAAAALAPTRLAGDRVLAGRLDEASRDLEQALKEDPNDGAAYALQSVIALARNDKAAALELADRGVERAPRSVPAAIAQSYARQAGFRIDPAVESARRATELEPANALAWARVAELELSNGASDRATAAAAKAVELDPTLSRTQSIVGFASLARIDTKSAAVAFRRAIELDSTDPLPRLGLGLAQIRDGDLAGGREQIEVAASLDPARSLIRSYLGKAYYEEKRDRLVEPQLAQARQLDPRDPTPYLYDAIRKQTENRPVEALQDLEESIGLNSNRAVFRSQLLLDEDQAARQVNQARIYRDLGFQQLALVDAYRSLSLDPGSASAHRLLADAYSDVERGDISKVSEALQAQLRQPVAIPAEDLLLSADNLFILRDNGPMRLGSNEFDELYDRNQIRVQADALVGSHGTGGDLASISGLDGRLGFAASQLHYETDGYGDNSAAKKDVYDAFVQAQVAPDATIQLDIRRSRLAVGHTFFAFDPSNAIPQELDLDNQLYRLGGRLATGPRSDLLWTAAYANDRTSYVSLFDGSVSTDVARTVTLELQKLDRFDHGYLVSGLGYYDSNDEFPAGYLVRNQSANGYIYGHADLGSLRAGVDLGLSADLVDEYYSSEATTFKRHRLNPKLGMTWRPFEGTLLRAAAFQTVEHPMVANQTLEVTQVSGFNQFFTGLFLYYGDPPETIARRYCVAIDQKLGGSLFAGGQLSVRRMLAPAGSVDFDWREKNVHAYLYKAFGPPSSRGWLARAQAAVSVEYDSQRFDRDPNFPGFDGILYSKTDRLPFSARLFLDQAIAIGATTSFIRQDTLFTEGPPSLFPQADHGWVTDAFVDYRLPRRLGMLTVGAKNVFDKRIQLFDTDPAFPRDPSGRFVYMRVRVVL